MKSVISSFSKEQRDLMDSLSKYHCLERRQVYAFLRHYLTDAQVKRSILDLQKKEILSEDEDYIKNSMYLKPNKRVIDSFWVLMEFFNNLNDPTSHYASSYPSTIFFISRNEQYEIVPIESGDYSAISILRMKEKNNPYPDNKTTYVFVAKSEDVIAEFASRVEGLDVIFALIKEQEHSVFPKVSLFKA